VFLAFSPLVLWYAWRDRLIRFFALFSAFYATAWFFQMHQLKFLIPAFAFWAVAVAAASASWISGGGFGRRALATAFLLVPVVCTLSVFGIYGRGDLSDKLAVALRPAKRDDFLRRRQPVYGVMDYINKTLPASSVIFAPDEQGLFYLKRASIIGWSNNQLVVDYRTMPAFSDLLARLKELGVTHLLFRPDQVPGPHVLVGAPHAAMVLLFRSIDHSCLQELHRENGLAVFKVQYPADLPAYDPTKHADRVALGDVLMEYGMLDRAYDQFRKAGQAGNEKREAIEAMDHQTKGKFYLEKARTWNERIFLKPSLDEFAAAKGVARSETDRVAAMEGLQAVRSTASSLAGHIWNRLPDTKWLVPHESLP
jgi:hypothetical protein